MPHATKTRRTPRTVAQRGRDRVERGALTAADIRHLLAADAVQIEAPEDALVIRDLEALPDSQAVIAEFGGEERQAVLPGLPDASAFHAVRSVTREGVRTVPGAILSAFREGLTETGAEGFVSTKLTWPDGSQATVITAQPTPLAPPVVVLGVDVSPQARDLSDERLADIQYAAVILMTESYRPERSGGYWPLPLAPASVSRLSSVLIDQASRRVLQTVVAYAVPTLSFELRECLEALTAADRATRVARELTAESARTGAGATLVQVWFKDPTEAHPRILNYTKEYAGQPPAHFQLWLGSAGLVDGADILLKAGVAVSKYQLVKDVVEAVASAPIDVGWKGVTQRFDHTQAQNLAKAFSDKELWGALTALVSMVNGFAGKIFSIVAMVFSVYAAWIRERDTGNGVVMRLVPVVFTVAVERP